MKRLFFFLPILLFSFGKVYCQINFDQYFTGQVLRIDYFHIGDAEREMVTLDQLYQYGQWPGSKKNLIDELNYGAYYYKVYEAASEKLIYSKGFDSYFKEYQFTEVASEGQLKTFHETAILPYPRQTVIFALEKRNPEGQFKEVFREIIDPDAIRIIKNIAPDPTARIFQSLDNGDIHQKADIAIIAEGYTVEQMNKFEADLERFTQVFFQSEPCRANKSKFNVYGVFKPSAESGVDQPRYGIYTQSAVEATFNSMGSERYLLTEDNKALRNIASHVPYDALYIMVNSDRYGGGGIYNFYCTFTSDNQWSEYLMVHEFGHSFFGLADEYYTSSVAYTDFYPAGYEPAEPNITALKDPENLKWKHLVKPSTPIPTPWNKETYDAADVLWQTDRSELNENTARLNKANDQEAAEEAEKVYNIRDREHAQHMQEMLEQNQYYGQVGAFEGAGYASTGLYRPMINCIMFSKSTPNFCLVCREAMQKIINRYAE